MPNPSPQPEEAAVPQHPALILAATLDTFFGGILRAVSLFQHFFPKIWVQAFNRISRGHQRATRLLRAVAAGTYTPPRLHIPGRARRAPAAPAPYLTRRFNALGILADWRFRGAAAPLAHLLAQPETLATLAALPPHARRTLGRVLATPCRLVGAGLPALLRPAGPPRPPRRRPSCAKPAPEPRRGGKYPRFNALRYSPGKAPPLAGPASRRRA